MDRLYSTSAASSLALRFAYTLPTSRGSFTPLIGIQISKPSAPLGDAREQQEPVRLIGLAQ
jgi:hypothetical protein